MTDSFSTHDTLEVNGERYRIASLAKLGKRFNLGRLPYSMKILLENLLRHEDGLNVTAKEIEAVANWDAKTES
jgi:aconitate hydratase